MKGRWTIRPIGVVRSEVKTTEEAPKQGALEGTEAEIVVDPACAPALTGLKEKVRPPGGPRTAQGPPAGKGGPALAGGLLDAFPAPAQSDLPAHGGAPGDPRERASRPRDGRDRRHAGRRHQAEFSGTGRVAPFPDPSYETPRPLREGGGKARGAPRRGPRGVPLFAT